MKAPATALDFLLFIQEKFCKYFVNINKQNTQNRGDETVNGVGSVIPEVTSKLHQKLFLLKLFIYSTDLTLYTQ